MNLCVYSMCVAIVNIGCIGHKITQVEKWNLTLLFLQFLERETHVGYMLEIIRTIACGPILSLRIERNRY